jgi:hypothetical protein
VTGAGYAQCEFLLRANISADDSDACVQHQRHTGGPVPSSPIPVLCGLGALLLFAAARKFAAR